MQIQNYGLFWRRDEVEWNPGTGKSFELLGRIGSNRPNVKIADFKYQQGIYILYGTYGPYYVGLANAGSENRGLGKRLLEHTMDEHSDSWDRFSWFGFKKVLAKSSTEGILEVQANLASVQQINPNDTIKNVEALLIRAMGCSGNTREMNFTTEQKWEQVTLDERKFYIDKLK
ncbi:MAG: GIY-YIG nuclease family protein [Bacteroidales bacterium]|nr:GIY-YIG nuclease family protein [Bacteroidales bacterium]